MPALVEHVVKPLPVAAQRRAAGSVLAGVELIYMVRKGQLAINGADVMSIAD